MREGCKEKEEEEEEEDHDDMSCMQIASVDINRTSAILTSCISKHYERHARAGDL